MSGDSPSHNHWWIQIGKWSAGWPEWVRNALGAVGPFVFGLSVSVPGWWKLVPCVAGALIWGLGQFSRSELNKEGLRVSEAAKTRLDERLKGLVEELRTALGSYARSLIPGRTPPKRKPVLDAALGSLVTQASWVTDTPSKTRANLFTIVSDQPLKLRASELAGVGGDDRVSTRVFTESDETVQAALELKGRLVNDATEPKYRSFATAPVYAAGQLYGILTVDAPGEDDLKELDQLQLMFYGQILGCVLSETQGSISVKTRG